VGSGVWGMGFGCVDFAFGCISGVGIERIDLGGYSFRGLDSAWVVEYGVAKQKVINPHRRQT
jgi:hypothetical protein